MLDKIAYVLANPVKAGLVRHGRQWPGLWSAPEQIGAGLQAVGLLSAISPSSLGR